MKSLNHWIEVLFNEEKFSLFIEERLNHWIEVPFNDEKFSLPLSQKRRWFVVTIFQEFVNQWMILGLA